MARRGNPNWTKGKSGNPSGKRRADAAIQRADGWNNVMTGLGYSGYDKTLYNAFEINVVSYQEAQDLWRGDDLGARAVETWPNEMLRRGFDLQISSDDATAQDLAKKPEDNAEDEPSITAKKKDGKRRDLYEEKPVAKNTGKEKNTRSGKNDQEQVANHWKEIGLAAALWRVIAFRRAYGGGAILLGVDDGQSLDKPLNLEKVKSFKFLTVLEARELAPLLYYADPSKPRYGEPAVYQLTPALPGAPVDGATKMLSVKIHESRLLVFNGISVSNSQLSTTAAGWGDSIFTRVKKVLADFQMSWSSTALLLHDFGQAVYGMRGLSEAISNDRDDEVITKMRLAERMRSTARAIIIDAEETFERKQTPVSGMPELLDLFCKRLAAAFDMPLTLLMGSSPGGLNATGESDIQLFYDRIAAAQQRDLLPALERVTKITFKALGIAEPESWSICFRPLTQPSEKEIAEAREIQSRTDERYINCGVVSPEEIAVERFGGDTYSFETKIDFEARAALQPVAEAPAKTTQQIEQEEKEAAEKQAQLEAVAKADSGI